MTRRRHQSMTRRRTMNRMRRSKCTLLNEMKIDYICSYPAGGITNPLNTSPGQILLRETGSPEHLYEKDVARRWYALPPGVQLPLSNGNAYQLIFAGRPGGALGPDVRDAIFHPGSVGDVEFHIRASDWFA